MSKKITTSVLAGALLVGLAATIPAASASAATAPWLGSQPRIYKVDASAAKFQNLGPQYGVVGDAIASNAKPTFRVQAATGKTPSHLTIRTAGNVVLCDSDTVLSDPFVGSVIDCTSLIPVAGETLVTASLTDSTGKVAKSWPVVVHSDAVEAPTLSEVVASPTVVTATVTGVPGSVAKVANAGGATVAVRALGATGSSTVSIKKSASHADAAYDVTLTKNGETSESVKLAAE